MQDIGKFAFGTLFVPTSLAAVHPSQAQGPMGLTKLQQSAIIIVNGNGGYASLKPKPLPPEDLAATITLPRDSSPVALNPQPLPPKGLFLRYR
jgi:hypothetical protein